jgi:hypothetical protein
MSTAKTFRVTTTAGTRGRNVIAPDARSAKTIYENLTGNKAGCTRLLK